MEIDQEKLDLIRLAMRHGAVDKAKRYNEDVEFLLTTIARLQAELARLTVQAPGPDVASKAAMYEKMVSIIAEGGGFKGPIG